MNKSVAQSIDVAALHSLQGKTALVTGASSGLGEYFAQLLAHLGAQVIVAARRVDKLEDLVASIVDEGGKSYSVAMDVSCADSVEAAFKQIDQVSGELDIVINNAGVANPPSKFVDQSEEDWSFVLDTNLKGAWRVAQQAAQRMQKAGKGSIINTGSIYSVGTGMFKADYNVSKVALAQLTKNMALELSRSGVRVNALCPGYFHSPMNEQAFSTEAGQTYLKGLVPQRLGELNELAGPLLLLASDAGSFVNGVVLPVDGAALLSPI